MHFLDKWIKYEEKQQQQPIRSQLLNDNRVKSVCTNIYRCEQMLFVRFDNNPSPVIRSTQFQYCTVSNPGTGADDAFVLKRGV